MGNRELDSTDPAVKTLPAHIAALLEEGQVSSRAALVGKVVGASA